jgi:LPXTG-motif cell wall-anchored protein
MNYHLGRDRNLAAWLLPVIRFRMELFLQAIRENRLAEFVAAHKKRTGRYGLDGIQQYLIRQGERSDIENLYRIYDEIFKFEERSNHTLQNLEGCLKEMEEESKRWELDDGPYWKSEAERWIGKGVLTEEDFNTALRAANSHRPTSHPGPLGPGLPLAGDPAPSAGAASPGQSPWHWLLWGGLSLAAMGLLWLLRKRRQ